MGPSPAFHSISRIYLSLLSLSFPLANKLRRSCLSFDLHPMRGPFFFREKRQLALQSLYHRSQKQIRSENERYKDLRRIKKQNRKILPISYLVTYLMLVKYSFQQKHICIHNAFFLGPICGRRKDSFFLLPLVLLKLAHHQLSSKETQLKKVQKLYEEGPLWAIYRKQIRLARW